MCTLYFIQVNNCTKSMALLYGKHTNSAIDKQVMPDKNWLIQSFVLNYVLNLHKV